MADVNLLSLVDGVSDFTGLPEDLELFIKRIANIYLLAGNLDERLKRILDLRIRQKIKKEANVTLINNNNPMNWPEIKLILKTSFYINESIECIIYQIKTLQYQNSVEDLYNNHVKLLTKLNIKACLSNDTPTWYDSKENEKMVLRLFTNKLPNNPKLILNARNPLTLAEAKSILIYTDNFYSVLHNNNPNVGTQNSYYQHFPRQMFNSENYGNNNMGRFERSFGNVRQYSPQNFGYNTSRKFVKNNLGNFQSSFTPNSENVVQSSLGNTYT